MVILSPHLDDTALCLGSFAVRAARQGVQVRSVTVLAGDPQSDAPPGDFDADAGFTSLGDATILRGLPTTPTSVLCESESAMPVEMMP